MFIILLSIYNYLQAYFFWTVNPVSYAYKIDKYHIVKWIEKVYLQTWNKTNFLIQWEN